MSAYVVSRAHIDYLIEAGLRLPRVGPLRWTDPTVPDPVWPCGGDADRVSEYWVACRARVRELNETTTHRVGAMLWAANHRSVSYRYDELQATPEYHYAIPYHSSRVDPVAVLKAVDCVEYQSCETPDWERSEAYAFLDALRIAAIQALPGYDEAPWDVQETVGPRA